LLRDVDAFHLEKAEHLALTSVEVVEKGPLRATVKCSLKLGQSEGTVMVRSVVELTLK